LENPLLDHPTASPCHRSQCSNPTTDTKKPETRQRLRPTSIPINPAEVRRCAHRVEETIPSLAFGLRTQTIIQATKKRKKTPKVQEYHRKPSWTPVEEPQTTHTDSVHSFRKVSARRLCPSNPNPKTMGPSTSTQTETLDCGLLSNPVE